jgi:hypothetical protein
MKKQIQIAVPKPCAEKWNSFTRTSNGGFCPSCRKEVIDFTSWSDERLKAYFKNRSGDTCGRFKKGQLSIYPYDRPGSTRFGWLSVLFASVLLLFSSRNVVAQRNPSKHPTEQYQGESKIGKVASTTCPIVSVRGLVKSPEDKNVIPGVNVVLKGTGTGTITDADGKFELVLENPPPSPVLIFSFIGFETAEYPVEVAKSRHYMRVDMWHEMTSLGEIVVGGATACKWYSPRTWWWSVKRLFW